MKAKLQWTPDELRVLMQQFMDRDPQRPPIVRRVAKRWRPVAAKGGDPTYNEQTHEYQPRDAKGRPVA